MLAQISNVTSSTTNRTGIPNYKKCTKTKTLSLKHNHPSKILIHHLQMCLRPTLNELRYPKENQMNSKCHSTTSLIRQV